MKNIEFYAPQLDDYLGRFTNEIKQKDGYYIQECISAGPKNYGYKLDSGETVCKIKGFSVNFIASQKLNFESTRLLFRIKDSQEMITFEQLKFIRNNYD